ncbi:hypothetical protein ACLOJK_025318 [Asimina triloba]
MIENPNGNIYGWVNARREAVGIAGCQNRILLRSRRNAVKDDRFLGVFILTV